MELMSVISISGVLVSIAVPSFGYMAANTKIKSASTELYLALIRARAESVKRNRSVTIAAISGDENNWNAGWRIIADANNDGAFDDVAGGGDRLVIEQGDLQRINVIMAPDSVICRPTGRLSGAQPAVDVASADPAYDLKRCILADLTGRPYIMTTACPP